MSGWPLLGPAEAAVARRVLAEESTYREHLVAYLSGAHAYGFASPDSDLDLKCVHVAPTAALLGLSPVRSGAERAGVVEGVEVDYSSNEVGQALAGALRGNGNFIERILGEAALVEGDDLERLRELVRGGLSRRVHHHYRGFALRQVEELRRAPSVKRLLYVLRTALTGIHLLRTAQLVTDVARLLPTYGPVGALELVVRKREGERVPLDDGTRERYENEVTRLLVGLDEARDRSPLPECPDNAAAVDAFLVELRRARL